MDTRNHITAIRRTCSCLFLLACLFASFRESRTQAELAIFYFGCACLAFFEEHYILWRNRERKTNDPIHH